MLTRLKLKIDRTSSRCSILLLDTIIFRIQRQVIFTKDRSFIQRLVPCHSLVEM